MTVLEKEELCALGVLLTVVVGLALFGKLTQEAVEAIKYIGCSAMAALSVKSVANK